MQRGKGINFSSMFHTASANQVLGGKNNNSPLTGVKTSKEVSQNVSVGKKAAANSRKAPTSITPTVEKSVKRKRVEKAETLGEKTKRQRQNFQDLFEDDFD